MMTNGSMNLQDLLEKTADPDFLRVWIARPYNEIEYFRPAKSG